MALKIDLNNIDIENLLTFNECEFLDFKQQYPTVKSDLIHDVLCLANASTVSDRVLIFGVKDNGDVCGVDNDVNRLTQADLVTIFRSSRLNKLPNFRLIKASYQNFQIDVLVIKNEAFKPYFLTEDYSGNGRPLRAGVVYSRIADTNIPVNSTASDGMIEKMYFERMGLDLTPTDRIKKYLLEFEYWKHGTNEEGNSYFFHEKFPEFTIQESSRDSRENYSEAWAIDFPDQNAILSEYFIKYNSTILTKIYLIWLDGMRFKRVQPKIFQTSHQGNDTFSYFYIENSIQCLVNDMILKVYPDSDNSLDIDKVFPRFNDVEEANKILSEDLQRESNYFYHYYFDHSVSDYFKIESGKKYRIHWKKPFKLH